MVKEFGEYLEELVKDYLVVIEGYELVEIEVPYSFKHPIAHISQFSSPSDIDVVGMKGNRVLFVSCREQPGNNKAWARDVRNLKRAKTVKTFYGHGIHLAVAFAAAPKAVKRKKILVNFFKVRGVRVLFFKDMATKLLSNVKEMDREGKYLTYGRYTWFFKWLIKSKLLT